MKKLFTSILLIQFSLLLLFVSPAIIFAGAVLVNNSSVHPDIIILPADASDRFQKELDKIKGLDARNARLTFSVDKGVEGSAYPVNVDMLKVENYNDNTAPFIGTTTGSMNIVGGVFARDGKIGFNRGTVTPATLNIFHIENAIENVLNSYIGSAYVGSVDVGDGQITAHAIDDPNPKITNTSSGSTTAFSIPSPKTIVPECNTTGDTDADPHLPGVLKYRVPCDFEMLGTLIDNVITFLLVYFATPLAALVFAYAGFLLIFSGGNEHNKGKAKSILGKVLVGYVIALAAWLIIHTILTVFLTPEALSWSFLKK